MFVHSSDSLGYEIHLKRPEETRLDVRWPLEPIESIRRFAGHLLNAF